MNKGRILMRLAAAMLALVCVSGLGARAEESNWFDFFRSTEGRISFTLPTVPDVMREADLDAPEDWTEAGYYIGWRNKLQLHGNTQEGTEYQVHIADVQPMLDQILADHPDATEINNQTTALINMAWFYISLHDGQFTREHDATVLTVDGREFADVRFYYEYPDTEGVEYAGRGIADGSQVVIMMGARGAELEAMFEEMTVVTAQEAEAFEARPSETVSLGRLQVTFPVPPMAQNDDTSVFYDAFTPGYAYLCAEHMPVDMVEMMGERPTDEMLEMLCGASAEGYVEEGVIAEYTIEKVAEGMYRIDCLGPESGYPEGTGPIREHTQMYWSLEGVYVISSCESPEGLAFLDSVVITPRER